MCIWCDPTNIDPNTVFLDCSNCKQITTLPESLPSLKFLIMYNTNISIVPKYESLEGLYCMNCPIDTIPVLPKLRKLNANGSNLRVLPNELYRLETIQLNDTNVVSIPDTLISAITLSINNTKVGNISGKLINLESLSVANTLIFSLGRMMSLQYLDCSGCPITSIQIDLMPNLRKIYARGCTFIDPFSIIESGVDLFN